MKGGLKLSDYRASYAKASSKTVRGMREELMDRIRQVEIFMLGMDSNCREWMKLATERSNLIANLPDYSSITPSALSRFNEENRYVISNPK